MLEVTRISRPVPELRLELASLSRGSLGGSYAVDRMVTATSDFMLSLRSSYILDPFAKTPRQPFDSDAIIYPWDGAQAEGQPHRFFGMGREALMEVIRSEADTDPVQIGSLGVRMGEPLLYAFEGRHRAKAASMLGIGQLDGYLVHSEPLLEGRSFVISSVGSLARELPELRRAYSNGGDFYEVRRPEKPLSWVMAGDTLTATVEFPLHFNGQEIEGSRELAADVFLARGAERVIILE